jgi:hypothetical protein
LSLNKEKNKDSQALSKLISYLFNFFFFGSTGVWTQGHVFTRQVLHPLSHHSTPSLFCFNYFSDRVWCFCPGPTLPPTLLGLQAYTTIACLVYWDRGWVTFCPGLASNQDPPTSVS